MHRLRYAAPVLSSSVLFGDAGSGDPIAPSDGIDIQIGRVNVSARQANFFQPVYRCAANLHAAAIVVAPCGPNLALDDAPQRCSLNVIGTRILRKTQPVPL
jgi:hypothetical protein